MVDPRVSEPECAVTGQSQPRGDERSVEAGLTRVADERLEILSEQGLTTGEAELEDAQRSGLGEDALPFLR